jgi:hypothetical protein
LLALHVDGIIGNGGFRYLFESGLPGDPHYQMALSAFRTLGCPESVRAFSEALALFPGGLPPTNGRERLGIYLENVDGSPSSQDVCFWDAHRTRRQNLNEYIRAHVQDFDYLDGEPPERPAEEEVEVPGEETPLVVRYLAALPHWARVAFAARCGRQALALFPRYWPEAAAEVGDRLRTALEAIETTTTTATAGEDVRTAVMNCMLTAGAADLESRKPGGPPDARHGALAAYCAKVIESAAETARSDTHEESVEHTVRALALLQRLVDDAGEEEILEVLDQDLGVLVERSGDEDWDDGSPMPADLWQR